MVSLTQLKPGYFFLIFTLTASIPKSYYNLRLILLNSVFQTFEAILISVSEIMIITASALLVFKIPSQSVFQHDHATKITFWPPSCPTWWPPYICYCFLKFLPHGISNPEDIFCLLLSYSECRCLSRFCFLSTIFP